MNRVPRWLTVIVLLIGGAPHAAAQDDGPGLRPHHLTVSGGLSLNGGYPVGDRNAELRRNAVGTPAAFTLFRADSILDRASGVEARIGFALTRALAIEVGGTYARPRLDITISRDSESTESVQVAEQLSQFTVDVSGVFQLPRVALGSRMRPYAAVGAGYLRQLHEDRLLVETGRIYHVGGGVRYWLRGGSATSRALGVRGDARYVRRTGGVDFENRSRGYPVVSILGFAGF
ncbi:MAG: hypothetical protein ACRD1H_16430 [Vicinamibacterales bacterium]